MIYPESEADDALGKSTVTQLLESPMLGIRVERAKCLNHILSVLEKVMIHWYRDSPRSPLHFDFKMICPAVNHLMIFRVEVRVKFIANKL